MSEQGTLLSTSREHIQAVQPEGWPRPRGYSNGMLASGTTVHIAGQIGWDEKEQFASEEVADQFAQALRNVVAVVRAAGGEVQDIVRLTAFITDLNAYRSNIKSIGAAYREIMGKHFPAMAFIGVSELVEPRAKVEIEATAVLATTAE